MKRLRHSPGARASPAASESGLEPREDKVANWEQRKKYCFNMAFNSQCERCTSNLNMFMFFSFVCTLRMEQRLEKLERQLKEKQADNEKLERQLSLAKSAAERSQKERDMFEQRLSRTAGGVPLDDAVVARSAAPVSSARPKTRGACLNAVLIVCTLHRFALTLSMLCDASHYQISTSRVASFILYEYCTEYKCTVLYGFAYIHRLNSVLVHVGSQQKSSSID